MMEYKIILRADGDTHIGLGHINRQLAIASILKENYHCSFAIRNPIEAVREMVAKSGFFLFNLSDQIPYEEEARNFNQVADFDIIVLDGYSFTGYYQQILKELGKKVVCIDDLQATHFFADAVINHAPLVNPENYSCEKYTKLYIGPAYALLREPFINAVKKKNSSVKLDSLFISFGGADPLNLTLKFFEMTKDIGFSEITVLTGGAYQHAADMRMIISNANHVLYYHNLDSFQLFDLLKKIDVAIVPSSTILFEVLATGIVALSGYFIENQKLIYEGFLKKGAIVGLGDLSSVSTQILMSHIWELRSEPEKIDVLRENTAKIFDGNAKNRIMNVFKSLVN